MSLLVASPFGLRDLLDCARPASQVGQGRIGHQNRGSLNRSRANRPSGLRCHPRPRILSRGGAVCVWTTDHTTYASLIGCIRWGSGHGNCWPFDIASFVSLGCERMGAATLYTRLLYDILCFRNRLICCMCRWTGKGFSNLPTVEFFLIFPKHDVCLWTNDASVCRPGRAAAKIRESPLVAWPLPRIPVVFQAKRANSGRFRGPVRGKLTCSGADAPAN